MRIAITIGNVHDNNIDDYIEGCKDRSTDGVYGPANYTITYGDGVWLGKREPNATFTLWANMRTCLSFENALVRTAVAKGEECVLVEESIGNVGLTARLRYEHKNVEL